MYLKNRWTTVLIWLAVSCIAALSCSLSLPAGRIADEYVPVGNDSFYHAARILEAVKDPASFSEFDAKIHAPEGSLLVWPWGYDYFISKLVRIALALGLAADPLIIMLWLPVSAVFVGTGMLMLVARRLGLDNWGVALAGLCLAVSASTQLLYGFGQIDHHYAEHICVLASLAAGLAWFKAPSATSAIALGVIFGIALAIHNALFILQAPFLATALLLWLQNERTPLRHALTFAAALLVTSMAMLLPSTPFQEGRFEFYTLSWFHLYIVCCTGLFVALLAYLEPTRRNVAALSALAAALLIPLLKQISYARSFVDGSLGMLDQILEMRSPLHMLSSGEITELMGFYSLLVFLAPATFVLCLLRLWRERRTPRLLFWVWCLFGLLLMTTQMRMHYFGTFALYLPWLIVVHEFAARRVESYKRALLLASLGLVLAYSPVIRYSLVAPVPPSADPGFMPLYPVFAPLRKACEEDPGIVLADTNAGHYIRYFTGCSVIANNFLLTEQQFAKAEEVSRLFALPAEELARSAPYVKYVLVRAGKITSKKNDRFSYEFFGTRPPGLSNSLLLGSPQTTPPEFELVYEVTMKMRKADSDRFQEVPYAKLYKIEPAAAMRPASVNNVGE